jgi:hypothetical protein
LTTRPTTIATAHSSSKPIRMPGKVTSRG